MRHVRDVITDSKEVDVDQGSWARKLERVTWVCSGDMRPLNCCFCPKKVTNLGVQASLSSFKSDWKQHGQEVCGEELKC